MIVIEPWHRLESGPAVAVFPVRFHVSEPPSSVWNASSTRPWANAVGWPRFGSPGEKKFRSPVASTVVPFGLS